MHHWGQWLTLLLVVVLIFITESREHKNKGKILSAQEAVIRLNDDEAMLIDLREAALFRKGHIISALNISADEFTQKMEKFKLKDLILVCDKGTQSTLLSTKLRKQGFSNPMVLSGGMSAWQNADLPMVKGK